MCVRTKFWDRLILPQILVVFKSPTMKIGFVDFLQIQVAFWKTNYTTFSYLLIPIYISPFSSPEPVVSWSRGRERRGSGSSRYRMLENFWHPVAHVQKLQISLLMLITDFCPSPLHWGKNFTSWALSREWLLWDVLKMHHFTQLGFTDNLELKEEENRNRLNTLLGCRTETSNRETIVWVIWVFFQYVWQTNTGKAISRIST